MKPIKTFVFLIMIAIGILFLSVLFPKEGVTVCPGVDLRFLSISELSIAGHEFLSYDKEDEDSTQYHYAAIIHPEKQSTNLNSDSVATIEPKKEEVLAEVVKPDRVPNIETSSGNVQGIIFPNDDMKCLDKFFENLYRLSSSSQRARILFIGDSQIERDRISGTLRENLQNWFTGEGIGFLPIKEVYNKKYGLIQKVSDNWKEYSITSGKKLEDRKFGVSGSYCKLDVDDGSKADGWIRFRKFRTDSLTHNNYKILNLYYSNPGHDTAYVEVLWKEKLIKKKKLLPGTELESLKYGFNFSPSEITLHFRAGNDLRLYGLSLECNNGIIVDNLPHRGCATPELGKTDLRFYRSMLEKMKVEMAIFQFGVNVVPYAGSNPKFYEDRLYRDLVKFRDLAPDVPILVVGVSDLAKKNGTRMESWPNIQAVKEAQIRAARRAYCAFWDLEAAMGGRNSMVTWVNSFPSLGKKDYIHFTSLGAEKVGDMLSNAILEKYQEFEERKAVRVEKHLAQN